jgi:hypothetical protein
VGKIFLLAIGVKRVVVSNKRAFGVAIDTSDVLVGAAVGE